MKALMIFEDVHMEKYLEMDSLLLATLPTELYKLTTKSFQNNYWLLNMLAYCFDFNVYKQANVNIVIRPWQHYNMHGSRSFVRGGPTQLWKRFL